VLYHDARPFRLALKEMLFRATAVCAFSQHFTSPVLYVFVSTSMRF
jgi:hypothetical protein